MHGWRNGLVDGCKEVYRLVETTIFPNKVTMLERFYGKGNLLTKEEASPNITFWMSPYYDKELQKLKSTKGIFRYRIR